MARVEEALAAAGLSLPVPSASIGWYVPAVRSGALVFTSGQLPMRDGVLLDSGAVGGAISVERAVECARQAALNALAAASTVCDLDEVTRVVKLTGYVTSAPGFASQPAVVDGASAVMLAAFGDPGRHARAAVGVASLPMGAPVEIEIVLEVG